jgi:hypothetical protein
MKIIIRYRETGTSTKMTLTEFPCSIGRSPTSQVCLPDESVSANHAVIEKRDGAFLIRDLESKNGLVLDGARLPSVALNLHTIISIGTIDIEVVDMTATLSDQTKSMMAPPHLNTPSIARSFAILGILPIVAILKTFFLSNTAIGFGIAATAFAVLIIVVFSAFSAWISSFFDPNYKFKKSFARILWLNALFSFANCIFAYVSAYVVFNLDDPELWTIIRTTADGLSMGAFLYFYSKEVFLLGRRRGLGIAGVTVTSLLTALIFVSGTVFSDHTHLSGAITIPLRTFTRENRSLADFDAKMKQSFEKVEKDRVKAFEKAQASEAESGK